MELLKSLQFHQAVLDCAAAGIIIVDNDTRIINANRAALNIIGKQSVDTLNCPLPELFINGERAELVEGLKLVQRQADVDSYSFYASFNSRVISVIISSIKLNASSAGWVVVLQPPP